MKERTQKGMNYKSYSEPLCTSYLISGKFLSLVVYQLGITSSKWHFIIVVLPWVDCIPVVTTKKEVCKEVLSEIWNLRQNLELVASYRRRFIQLCFNLAFSLGMKWLSYESCCVHRKLVNDSLKVEKMCPFCMLMSEMVPIMALLSCKI